MGAVFVVVIVNLVGVALRDLLNRIVFLFQLSHVAFERALELTLRTPKFSDGFSDRLAQFWQLLGAEQDKRDEKNNDQFLHTDRTHGKTSFYDSKGRAVPNRDGEGALPGKFVVALPCGRGSVRKFAAAPPCGRGSVNGCAACT